MATPTGPTRRQYAQALKKGTTWGTAVAVGALDGVLAKDDGGFALKQTYDQYPAVDQIMAMDGALSLIGACDFAPSVDLQYEFGAWGRLLAAFFGTAGAPVQQGGTAGYLHTFQWADFPTNFFTYVQERPGKIWEIASAMPFKFSLKNDKALQTALITCRGNTLVDNSAVNTATQVDAITYADRGHFVNFIEGAFWMNLQSGGALAIGDKVEISGFELSMERMVDAVPVLGSSVIASPAEGEFPKATLKLTLPRATATNAAYMTAFQNMTAQKASFVFTGPLISGAVYYSFSLFFPRLKYSVPPEIKLDPVLKNVLTFEIEAASAAPTGMTYARPYCQAINLQTTDYLA